MSLPLPEALDAEIGAFVLAGGRSSRMGRDKALIQLQGAPLIQHALEILRAAGLNPRIAGGNEELHSFAPVIPDNIENAGLGPLSGICSALAAASAHYNLFLPVDLPLIPPRLISYLIHHAKIVQSTVTVVSVAGFIQTFPAVIDRSAAQSLNASLHSSDRKCLKAFQLAAEAAAVPLAVLPIELFIQAGQIPRCEGQPPSQWFLNINTLSDLEAAKSFHMIVNPGSSPAAARP